MDRFDKGCLCFAITFLVSARSKLCPGPVEFTGDKWTIRGPSCAQVPVNGSFIHSMTKKQKILIKKASVQTIGSWSAIPTHPRSKALDLAKVWCPTAWLRIAFCGSCLKHWTSQLVLPLLAPLESWSLFSWVPRCLFDILLTCAFAKQVIVPLLIGQDLVSREESVPTRLSLTSLLSEK